MNHIVNGKFTLEEITTRRRYSRNRRTVECNSEAEAGEGDEEGCEEEAEAGEGDEEVGDEGDSHDGSGHEEGAASS